MVIGLGAHELWLGGMDGLGTVCFRSSGQGLCRAHHLGKVLHSAAYFHIVMLKNTLLVALGWSVASEHGCQLLCERKSGPA